MSVTAGAGSRWSVVALVALAVAATVATLWPAAGSIAGNWIEIHDYRHGFLIAPLAFAWLLAVAYRIPSPPIRVSPVGCVMLAGALFLWLVAMRANSDIAIETFFPAIIWLVIFAAAGWTIAREAIAPVAYLYFAIPVWEFLLPTLQWLSVGVTEAALAFTGVPAEVSEYLVTLPSGSFEIVEGCSGKRYFIVALAVSVIAGALQRLRGWRMAALLVAGGLLALAANWLRIFVVIYAGYATEMQHYLVAVEHQTFGNVIFAALLIAIYVTARILAWKAPQPTRPTPLPVELPQRRRVPQGAALVPFILLGVSAGLVHSPAAVSNSPSGQLGHLPVVAGRWQGPLPAASAWSPRYKRPDAERRASYRLARGSAVEIYLNLYSSQQAGRELVYYENSLLAPGVWSQDWPRQTTVIEIPGAPALALMEAHGPQRDRWLLAYVYKIGGWTMVRDPLAQASYGLQSLLRPVPAGMVSLTIQCGENCQEAQVLVRDFWQEMSSSIIGMIPDDAD